MNDMEGRTALAERGEDRMVTRRGLLAGVVAVPLALAVGGESEAAKKDKHRKSKHKARHTKGKGKKKGKNKKQGVNGSAGDVVRVAQKYKGAKYVWGGASPKGFDCSGFTWYVYQKATGADIGRTVKAQWKQGHTVSRGSLRKGDIVFFKNTFEKGLSHCGISLGGTKFIHAENERTGVVISDLSSGYYDDHYAGARRLL